MVRLYFHLADSYEVIPDLEGVEVSDLQEARAQAARAIEELRRENRSAVRDWLGWTLIAADESGKTLFSLDLEKARIGAQ